MDHRVVNNMLRSVSGPSRQDGPTMQLQDAETGHMLTARVARPRDTTPVGNDRVTLFVPRSVHARTWSRVGEDVYVGEQPRQTFTAARQAAAAVSPMNGRYAAYVRVMREGFVKGVMVSAAVMAAGCLLLGASVALSAASVAAATLGNALLFLMFDPQAILAFSVIAGVVISADRFRRGY